MEKQATRRRGWIRAFWVWIWTEFPRSEEACEILGQVLRLSWIMADA